MTENPQRTGFGMMLVAAMGLLALLTWFFSGQLEDRVNPNRQVQSQVIGGSVNGQGALTVRVTTAGEEGFVQRVIDLVEGARDARSRTQGLADRAAFWLTLVALGAGGVPPGTRVRPVTAGPVRSTAPGTRVRPVTAACSGSVSAGGWAELITGDSRSTAPALIRNIAESSSLGMPSTDSIWSGAVATARPARMRSSSRPWVCPAPSLPTAPCGGSRPPTAGRW